MIFENCAIGRTKIILSIEDSEPASGFLAVLSAEIDNNLKEEVNFRGPGEFAPSTQEHIRSIIYPLITKILTKLKINPTPIVISLANVGAASIQKQKLYVKGFSADIPIFLSILSIYLNIPLPQDYVITGHISSNQGDISLVEAIPGKIHGTMRYSEISHFVCPDPDMDQSAKIINPGSTEEIKISIANAKKNIKFILEKMEGTYLDRSWLKHVTDIEEFNLDEHNDLNFICVGLRFKIKKSWFLADNFYLRLNGEGHSIADGEERYLIKTILDDTSIKKTKSENISLEELDKGIKLNPEVTDIIMPLKYYSHRMFLNPEKFRVESFQPFYFFESKKIRIHWATSKMDLNNNIIFLNNKAISVVKKNVSDISPIDSIPDYREFNLENRKISSLLRLEEIDVDITLRSCLSIKINYPSKVSILSVNNFE